MRMNNELLGKLGIFGVAIVLATAGTSACKPGDDTADEAGDGDGDTTGDGDGSPGDGDGSPGDGDGSPGDGDGSPGDGDGEPECPTHDPGEGAANEEACYSNNDCASKHCERFQDAPMIDGACRQADDMCRTRIMGRILDFDTRETVGDIELRVAQALMASLDPVNAAAIVTTTSDQDGIFDVLSDDQIVSPLAIVGLARGDGYYLTSTGLASPATGNFYGPANGIRDIWVVPTGPLGDWSSYLETDVDFTDQLPLGEAGGVVGLVRSLATGDPIANAKIIPASPDTSGAVIRYLNEDGTGFDMDMTSSRGVFVLVKPGLGETFSVTIDDDPVPGVEARAGSANGAVFTMIMNIPG